MRNGSHVPLTPSQMDELQAPDAARDGLPLLSEQKPQNANPTTRK
jgi:hypothetical protein